MWPRGPRGFTVIELLVVISSVGASSYHPGGVNVGFLDGPVRFVKDSVDPTSWAALGTRAGGEIVPVDMP